MALTLAEILALVEKRLSWYGRADWRVRDAVCGAEFVVVVVCNRQGEAFRLTVARDSARTVSTQAADAAPKIVALARPAVMEGRYGERYGERRLGAA